MTLTQTAIITKQAIIISIIALVLSITSFVGYKIWYAYYLANLPPVEEKPDNKFGLLPKPIFPESDVSTSNFSYSIDTVTGGLPKVGQDEGFEKIIKVYFINQTVATLLSYDRSQALAEKFKITSPPEILSETKYKFTEQGKSLSVDLDNGNFSYTNDASIAAQPDLDDDNQLVAGFKQMLSSLGVLKNDLQNGKSKVNLLKINGNTLIPTEVRSEAQAAQISLWPAPLEKQQIFTPDFNVSHISATVLNSSNNLDNYKSLNFTYYPIDTSTFATYYLKTPQQAFEELKIGKGVVVITPDKPQVSITGVTLGYYLQENYISYLQPIFIFEGPGFAAYTPALGE